MKNFIPETKKDEEYKRYLEFLKHSSDKPYSSDGYNKNETMKLLGEQNGLLFWYGENVEKQIKDIAEARPYSFTFSSAADIFLLGYIHGKRAERKRKRNVNTKQQ